ncbi:MAG TPA: response regulator transcription factor [Pseudonocardiaceae bacterium]
MLSGGKVRLQRREAKIRSGRTIAEPRVPNGSANLTVAVAHHDELIRAGLEALVVKLSPVRAVTSCQDWPDLNGLLSTDAVPDVLIIAHRLVRRNDERMATIKSSAVRALLLLEDADNAEIAEAACLDPGGFLVERGLTTSILLTALRQTTSGQVSMAPQVTNEMLAELQNPNRLSVLGLNQLTPRERQTLKLLVEGFSNKQIAHRLGIGINGAKRHVANVLAKLNCPNRTIAATEAVRLGVI